MSFHGTRWPNYIYILTCYGTTIECSKKYKVLGVTIEDKITSPQNFGNLIKKANKNLHVLSRIKCYIGLEQKKLIISFFVKSQILPADMDLLL